MGNVAKERGMGSTSRRAAGLTDENGVGLDVPAGWTPEHLLLAALLRCSVKSLRAPRANARESISLGLRQ